MLWFFANTTFHQINYAAAFTNNVMSDYKGVFVIDTLKGWASLELFTTWINWSGESWLAFSIVKFIYVQNFLVIKNFVALDYVNKAFVSFAWQNWRFSKNLFQFWFNLWNIPILSITVLRSDRVLLYVTVCVVVSVLLQTLLVNV